MSDRVPNRLVPASKIQSGSFSAVAVRWNQVGLFLALTFGLTWLLDLIIYLKGGLRVPGLLFLLQLQMLLPAFSAIVLEMFVFRDSSIYYRTNRTASRWFFFYYLALTALYVAVGVLVVSRPDQVTAYSGITQLLMILGLLLVVVLRIVGGETAFDRASLWGGKLKYWGLFGVGVALFYGLQTLLNYVFGLGKPADIAAYMAQVPGASMSPVGFVAAAAVNTIVIGPLVGLLISFGEEYGWRGFLQRSLVNLGLTRGILIVGVIWGLWHAPIILMGYNYPGYPVLGVFLMTAYTIVLGFVLGYAVLKSGSIWLAAFLHGLNNQTLSFMQALVYAPNNPVLAFGIGVFGILSAAVVVFLILRDPLWRRPGQVAR